MGGTIFKPCRVGCLTPSARRYGIGRWLIRGWLCNNLRDANTVGTAGCGMKGRAPRCLRYRTPPGHVLGGALGAAGTCQSERGSLQLKRCFFFSKGQPIVALFCAWHGMAGHVRAVRQGRWLSPGNMSVLPQRWPGTNTDHLICSPKCKLDSGRSATPCNSRSSRAWRASCFTMLARNNLRPRSYIGLFQIPLRNSR